MRGEGEMALAGMTRRELLAAGSLGLLGLTVSGIDVSKLGGTTAHGPKEGRAKSVILLWMDGGPSQLETFEPQPKPTRVAGSQFGDIRTTVPGLRICELLPRMARVMDRCTLIRTLSHEESAHDRACHLLSTGLPPQPLPVCPSIGSVAALQLGPAGAVPPYVAIGGRAVASGYAMAGRLGSDHDPFLVDWDLDGARFGLSRAFRIQEEPAPVRARYGRHRFGQACLLARRLVEDGARFVMVSHGGWDTHSDNAAATRGWLVPPLDQGMSGLIEDLDQRGLLEATLVVWMGEFGRTPWLNALGGRDHWPRVGCALFAGAGVPRGQVLGRTDENGAEPVDRTFSPQAVAATIYAKLGVGHRTPDGPPGKGEYIPELG